MLLHNKTTKVGIIGCRFSSSGSVDSGGNTFGGGVMTCGTMDANGSALISFPAFISAPTIVGTYQGFGARTANISSLMLTGVTVSNAYISIGGTPASKGYVNLILAGEVKL